MWKAEEIRDRVGGVRLGVDGEGSALFWLDL